MKKNKEQNSMRARVDGCSGRSNVDGCTRGSGANVEKYLILIIIFNLDIKILLRVLHYRFMGRLKTNTAGTGDDGGPAPPKADGDGTVAAAAAEEAGMDGDEEET